MRGTRTILVVGILAVAAFGFCAVRDSPYQILASDDGRCRFVVTEETEWVEARNLLHLSVTLDDQPVLGRSYCGSKHLDRVTLEFVVLTRGDFYVLVLNGYPQYPLAAVDRRRRVVWFQSTEPDTEHIDAELAAVSPDPMKLTDLNWLQSRVKYGK